MPVGLRDLATESRILDVGERFHYTTILIIISTIKIRLEWSAINVPYFSFVRNINGKSDMHKKSRDLF